MSDSGRLDTGLFEELKLLTDASLRGEINAAQVTRLEHLLRDPAAMDLYLDLVWESHILATWAKPWELEQLAESSVKSTPWRAVRSTTGKARGFFRPVTRPLRRYPGDPRYALAMAWIATLLFAGTMAGVLAAITAMFRGANPPDNQQIAEQEPARAVPVARLIRVSDCVWSGEIHSPFLGDDLVAGRKLVMKSGLAEFVFRNGAKTIVEGPAVCEFSSSASVGLSRGKCAVTVEDSSARGFVVDAPGMKYTDLGTEFGVLVAESGVQEMHVFRGQVQAEQGREPGAGSRAQGAESKQQSAVGARSMLHAPRSSLIVSAHEAIRVAALDPSGKPGKPIEHIAADEKRFVRVILEPIPLFGTGVGLDRGANDLHWEITKISTDPPFYRQNQLAKPQPAVVVVPESNYARDNRDKAQWISNSEPKHNLPIGCRWTLRTHFDLTGFDVSSARIEGQVCADNYVVELRVNGKAAPMPPGNRDDALLGRWLLLRIEEGFVAGDNTLEIVLENGDGTGPGNPVASASPMAICLELKGLAQRTLTLKAKD